MGTIGDLLGGIDLSAFTGPQSTSTDAPSTDSPSIGAISTGAASTDEASSASGNPDVDSEASGVPANGSGDARPDDPHDPVGAAGGVRQGSPVTDSPMPPTTASYGEGDAASGAQREELTPEEAAIEALLEYTDLQPGDARRDLTLRSDLDMDDLQLYAVVTRMEHTLTRSFSDADIRSWEVVGDILDAVAAP